MLFRACPFDFDKIRLSKALQKPLNDGKTHGLPEGVFERRVHFDEAHDVPVRPVRVPCREDIVENPALQIRKTREASLKDLRRSRMGGAHVALVRQNPERSQVRDRPHHGVSFKSQTVGDVVDARFDGLFVVRLHGPDRSAGTSARNERLQNALRFDSFRFRMKDARGTPLPILFDALLPVVKGLLAKARRIDAPGVASALHVARVLERSDRGGDLGLDLFGVAVPARLARDLEVRHGEFATTRGEALHGVPDLLHVGERELRGGKERKVPVDVVFVEKDVTLGMKIHLSPRAPRFLHVVFE